MGVSLSGVSPQISSSCHKSLSYPLLGAERDDTGVRHHTGRGLMMRPLCKMHGGMDFIPPVMTELLPEMKEEPCG